MRLFLAALVFAAVLPVWVLIGTVLLAWWILRILAAIVIVTLSFVFRL